MPLFGLGNYEEAIKWYDKALAIDPEYAQTYYNKGSSLYALGRYKEAIPEFDKCIELIRSMPGHTSQKAPPWLF